MFGYVTTGPGLSDRQKERYRAHYCGLCRCLGEEYGFLGRLTLTFDMTFLAMLLGAVYEEEEAEGILRCPALPLRKRSFAVSAATQYAADMNLILAYYKYLDDWNDDKNIGARAKSRMLEGWTAQARRAWPRQCAAIEESLALLGEMEKNNELNPDLPANAFASLMSQLFAWREDEYAPHLAQVGASLGRFLYLMDARLDLRADIKKQRYNPLIALTDTDFTPMLTLLIGECTQAFEGLPLKKDADILRNILYSGVWVTYISKTEGKTS